MDIGISHMTHCVGNLALVNLSFIIVDDVNDIPVVDDGIIDDIIVDISLVMKFYKRRSYNIEPTVYLVLCMSPTHQANYPDDYS